MGNMRQTKSRSTQNDCPRQNVVVLTDEYTATKDIDEICQFLRKNHYDYTCVDLHRESLAQYLPELLLILDLTRTQSAFTDATSSLHDRDAHRKTWYRLKTLTPNSRHEYIFTPKNEDVDDVVDFAQASSFKRHLDLWLELQKYKYLSHQRQLRSSSLRLYKKLFDDSDDFVFIVDTRDASIMYSNVKAQTHFGQQIPVYASLPTSNIHPPPASTDSLARHLAYFVAQNHELNDHIISLRNDRHEHMTVSVRLKHLEDDSLQSQQYLFQIRPIPDSTRLEVVDQHEKQHHNLKYFVNALDFHVVFLDDQGQYLFANQAHLQWLKSDPQRVSHHRFSQLFGGNPMPEAVEKCIRVASLNTRASFEHTITSPQKDRSDMVMCFFPLRNYYRRGEPVRATICMMVDMTWVKQFHNTHIESQKFLQLSDQLPFVFFSINQNDGRIATNKAWAEYAGKTTQETTSEPIVWKDIIHRDDLASVDQMRANMLKGAHSSDAICRIQRFDGSYQWHLIRCFMANKGIKKAANYDFLGVCINLHNLKMDHLRDKHISQIRADEARRAYQAWAKERFKVSELHEDRDIREQFVVALSHDLRTPLSAAQLGLQLLMRKVQSDPSLKSIIDRSLHNLQRADILIANLLDVTRVYSGKPIVLNLSPLSVREVIATSLQELAYLHNGRCQFEAEDDFHGQWDKDAIYRVVYNLVNNAIKYGDPNTPIHIKLYAHQHNVCISVHNMGDPISEEDQKHIFNPFSRIFQTRKDQAVGWGIGLTLVHTIAHAHGGNVLVQSSQQEGTTFTVKFPLGHLNCHTYD